MNEFKHQILSLRSFLKCVFNTFQKPHTPEHQASPTLCRLLHSKTQVKPAPDSSCANRAPKKRVVIMLFNMNVFFFLSTNGHIPSQAFTTPALSAKDDELVFDDVSVTNCSSTWDHPPHQHHVLYRDQSSANTLSRAFV